MTKERILLMAVRAALLAGVDAIEEYLEIKRTKDLRKIAKQFRVVESETLVGYHVKDEI